MVARSFWVATALALGVTTPAWSWDGSLSQPSIIDAQNDVIFIKWSSAIDDQGRVKLPTCSDRITIKLLMDLLDGRTSLDHYLSVRSKTPDGKKPVMMVEQVKVGPNKAEAETVTVADKYQVTLNCEAVVTANRDAGLYHYGYFGIAKDGELNTVVFAAKPQFGDGHVAHALATNGG